MQVPRYRNIGSYLALPRRDNVIKWLVSPGAFIVSAVPSTNWRAIGTFILIWFTFEFLIYQARYQWNDLRGIAYDRNHPDQARRGRLPPGKNQRQERMYILASTWVVGARLLIAIVLGFMFHLVFIVMLLLLVAFFLGFSYEWAKVRRNRPSARVSMWLVVGVGYVARGSIGLILGSHNILSAEVILGSLCFGVLGTMAGMMTSAAETVLYSSRNGHEHPQPGRFCNERTSSFSPPSSAPAQSRRPLVSLINGMYPAMSSIGIDIMDFIRAPWNMLCVIAAGLAGEVGMQLSLAASSTMLLVFAVVCGLLVGIFCVSDAGLTARWVVCIFVVCGLGMIAQFPGGAKFAFLAGVPVAAVCGTYTVLRMMMDRQNRRLSGTGDSQVSA